MLPRYNIQSVWGPRYETPEEIAPRFRRMTNALSTIDPVFGDWLVGHRKMTPLAPLNDDEIVSYVAAGIPRDDLGVPEPWMGFHFIVTTARTRLPVGLIGRIVAGRNATEEVLKNSAVIRSEPLEPQYASFINIGVMKPAMLAMNAAWEADWCQVYPWDLMPLWTKPWRSRLELAWMTYLSPRLAALVTPPRTAIVERPPGGGLLMIATEDRFSSDDPAHVAVARDIKDAMAPVNALPWPHVTG